MTKISDEAVRRSKGVNLPGGIPQKANNSITGDLSSIIELSIIKLSIVVSFTITVQMNCVFLIKCCCNIYI